MAKVRLIEGEICEATRSSGAATSNRFVAVVLETDGSLSEIATERLAPIQPFLHA